MTGTTRPNLLCVTGLTPQVVTETVYALVTADGSVAPGRAPRRIEVVTTTEGRRRLQLSLLSANGGKGHFDRLCADYGIERSGVEFDASCIHVIRDRDGRELADITDESHNAAAADLINERIRALCDAEMPPLHVSLAGGRKTMGFYAGYALSLYARPEDRLSHVLVNAPFESHPDFFYPPSSPITLVIPPRKDYVSTADAQIRLAEIPIVRLRSGLDDNLLRGALSYSEAVARAQEALEEPDLLIDLATRRVSLQGHVFSLSTLEFAWLTWMARRTLRGEPPVAFDEVGAADLMDVMRWLEGDGPSKLKQGLESGVSELVESGKTNYFDRNRTRLKTALVKKSGLHPSVVEHYKVHSFGSRPHTTYGLRLLPSQVRIVGEP
jgi:CRISPR-associated protein (TIGR02584 family)